MIKCKISKKKKRSRIKANSTPSELVVETLALVQVLYDGLAKDDHEAAMEYKNTLIGVLLDPNSPIFKKGAALYE